MRRTVPTLFWAFYQLVVGMTLRRHWSCRRIRLRPPKRFYEGTRCEWILLGREQLMDEFAFIWAEEDWELMRKRRGTLTKPFAACAADLAMLPQRCGLSAATAPSA